MVIRVKVACVFGYVNYRLPLCQHFNRFVEFHEILEGNFYDGEAVNQFLLLLVVNDLEYLPGSSLKIRLVERDIADVSFLFNVL